MNYKFKDLLNSEIYESTRVMFILGKYIWFSNLVCDTLKSLCITDEYADSGAIGISAEFGFDEDDTDDDNFTNSVDIATFFEVIGVPNVNGKWYCKVELNSLTKKQKETVMNYIRTPSSNGILVIVSNEWRDYKDILRSKVLQMSKYSHIFQLGFPSRQVLSIIVKQEFKERKITIDQSAIDYFIMQMSMAYDEYEQVINDIAELHSEKQNILAEKDIKQYMKGIEHYTVDDLVEEIAQSKPKKSLKMMASLEDNMGAKNLLYQVLNRVNEYLEFRILINSGYIPVGITYFFIDVVNSIPNNAKYAKMQEWQFRKKVNTASLTSLVDWAYIKLILYKAIENNKVSDAIMEERCKRALCDVCTRQNLSADRLNNIVGFSDILKQSIRKIDNFKYNEKALKSAEKTIELIDNQ